MNAHSKKAGWDERGTKKAPTMGSSPHAHLGKCLLKPRLPEFYRQYPTLLLTVHKFLREVHSYRPCREPFTLYTNMECIIDPLKNIHRFHLHLSCRFNRPSAWPTYRSGWGRTPESHGNGVVHTPVKRGLCSIPFLPDTAEFTYILSVSSTFPSHQTSEDPT